MKQINEFEKKDSLILTSKPNNIAFIEPFVEKFRCQCNFNDEVYGNILVAITEAVNNAIIHGNKLDPEKKVEIQLLQTGNNITCTIEDNGGGFDYNNLPDPTSPENIENIGGRGVFLMKNLSDLVIFSKNGSYVEIQFKI